MFGTPQAGGQHRLSGPSSERLELTAEVGSPANGLQRWEQGNRGRAR